MQDRHPSLPRVLLTGGLLGLVAASSACSWGPYSVAANLDEDVPTVVSLQWTSIHAGSSWVEYGGEGLETTSTPTTTTTATDHEHLLLGIPPYQDVWYRAITLVDGVEHVREGEVRTGGLPPELPDMTVTVDQPELRSEESYLLGTMFGLVPGIFAVDRAGNWNWFHLLESDVMPVERERDGDGFLFNTFAADYTQDDSGVHRMAFADQQTWSEPTELGHHAFTQMPNGALAWLTLDVRDWLGPDGEIHSVVGDAVVVLDEDGEEHVVFSTWDWIEPVITEYWEEDLYGLGKDWSHANTLRWDDERGTLLLSFRNLETVVELWLDQNRWDAQPILQLGGVAGSEMLDDGDIYRLEGRHGFDYLHNPGFTDTGTFMAMVEQDGETHAVEWALDHGNRALRELDSYGDGEALRTMFLGMVTELDNGNLLLTYSSEGLVREVTPDGVVAWELQASVGAAFGHTLLFDSYYEP